MFIKVLLGYIFGYVRIRVEGLFLERFINLCTTRENLALEYKEAEGDDFVC